MVTMSSPTPIVPTVKICYYGKPCIFRISWSSDDFGRKYRDCANHEFSDDCGYLLWLDPPTSDHGKQFAELVLAKIEMAEVEVHVAQKTIEKMRKKEKKYELVLKTTEDRLGLNIVIMVIGWFFLIIVCIKLTL